MVALIAVSSDSYCRLNTLGGIASLTLFPWVGGGGGEVMDDPEFTVFLRHHTQAGNLNMRERRGMKRPPCLAVQATRGKVVWYKLHVTRSRWMVFWTDFTSKRYSMTNGKTMLHARQNIVKIVSGWLCKSFARLGTDTGVEGWGAESIFRVLDVAGFGALYFGLISSAQ